MKARLYFGLNIVAAVLLLLVSCGLRAQKKAFLGYYINFQHDTIRGVFDGYSPWNYNPGKAGFTPAGGGTRLLLDPANCKEFCIDTYDTYLSYSGPRMTNPTDFGSASSPDNTDQYDSVTVFLRQIASTDQYRFYIYKDRLRINLYYSGRDQEVKELVQKAALINNSYWKSMQYKQQLKALFPQADKAAIDRLGYSEESLAAFVEKQGGRGNEAGKVPHTNHGGLVVLGGMSYNTFTSRADPALDFSGRAYGAKTVPVAALGYMIFLNRSLERVFLLPEVKVFSFKHSTVVQYNSSNPYPAVAHTFQAAPVISLAFHVGYNIIHTNNLSVALAPGGGFSVLAKNRKTDQYLNSPTETKMVVTEMDKGTALADIQAFVTFKKRYLLWLSYHLPVPVTTYNPSAGKLSSVQGGVGIKF